jgi:rod shape-determining protein MreD
MFKRVLVFFLAFVLGLLIQAFVHSFESAWIAPDFILILVVYLGLYHKSAWGVVGAFVLGLGADFAEARFIGPNAAGCVLAFCLTVELSNRFYAEKGLATALAALPASAAKLFGYSLILAVYTNVTVLNRSIAVGMVKEVILTAALTPFVIRALLWGGGRAFSRAVSMSEVYRR